MKRSPQQMLALLAVLGLYLATNAAPQCHAQESTWIGSVSSANWFDTVRWNNGVPNATDATAIFPAGSSLILQVNQQVKLAELRIVGSRALNLSGNGPFFFDRAGADPAKIQYVAPLSGVTSSTLSVPITSAAGEQLLIDLGQSTTLALSGALSSALGDLTKTGAGTLVLSGANSNWNGNLFVAAGITTVSNAVAFGSASGTTTISDGATLAAELSTSEPFTLNAGTLQVRNLTLSGPITLQGTGTVFRPKNPLSGGTETSTGASIVASKIAGSGDFVIQNLSLNAVNLTGQNTYTGKTYIKTGDVLAANATSLGASDGGTIVQGGKLTVQAANQEKYRVEGGQLIFAAGSVAPLDPVVIAGGAVFLPALANVATPIVVEAPGGALNAQSTTTAWTGGSTGAGTLTLGGQINANAPLVHLGDLIIAGAKLNVANSYTGNTFVAGNAVLNHSGGFGQSPSVRMQNGLLTLNVVPAAAPAFYIERGTLDVPTAIGPISNTITMGGASNAVISGQGTFTGPMFLIPATSGRNELDGGTFNGPISGNGGLRLGVISASSIVNLNAVNNIRGPIEVSGGVVNVNNSNALVMSSTFVNSGRLNLNQPTVGNVLTIEINSASEISGTVSFNAPQNYSAPWVVNAGSIETTAQIGMEKLVLVGLNNSARVRSQGGSFLVNDKVQVLYGGAIEGGLKGNADINLFGKRLTMAGDLMQFTGDVYAHSGSLEIGLLASNFTAATSLNPNTQIHIYPDAKLGFFPGSSNNELLIDNDIFLHNANGAYGQIGGLYRNGGNGTQVFRGRIDVGDQGSTIDGPIQIRGRLTGTNLTTHDGVEIQSAQTELRGMLRIDDGAVTVNSAGRLQGLDAILIQSGGQLTLESITASPQDRVDDAIPIRSRGGRLNYLPSTSGGGETLGALYLDRAQTRLFTKSQNPLTFTSLTRERGATVNFSLFSGAGGTGFVNAPPLQNGMIGGWATTDNGFATIGPAGRFDTLATSSTTLDTAGSTDHVFVQASQSITADRVIASLRGSDNSDINLAGHRLSVSSGGIFRGNTIRNGALTAGGSGDAELVVTEYVNTISANIVDNAGGGHVALVVNEGRPHLSGQNSYTGGTWVTGIADGSLDLNGGTLWIESYSAIPANDRVYVDNGIYQLEHLPAGTVQLEELHVREGGLVTSGLASINAKRYYFEEGQVNATLVGSGTVLKDGDGALTFSNAKSPNFTGQFTVRGGVAQVSYDQLPQAQFVVEGGKLDITGSLPFTKTITLKGGTLGGDRLTGAVNVLSDSQLFHDGLTLLYGPLTGSGNLTIRGRGESAFNDYVGLFGNTSSYSGNIRVESGALRIGKPSNGSSGTISVMGGGKLILGSNAPSDPATSIGNETHVYGGVLYSTPPTDFGTGEASPSIFAGQVLVHDEAYIGAQSNGFKSGQLLPGLTFSGKLSLADNARVYGLSDTRSTLANGAVALVDISGELGIGSNTTWCLLTSSLSISGTIRAANANSSINFLGEPELLRLSGASVRIDAGQSLSLQVNGQPQLLVISGGGNAISGSGTVGGGASVSGGAAIAPGSSPGILTIDGSTTIGPGGKLSIELAGTTIGEQYDSLHVLGNVVLDGALLDLSLLGGFQPAGGDEFVVLQATNGIFGRFTNAANSIVVGSRTFQVLYEPNSVSLLASAVPEPATMACLIWSCLTICARRRRFR